MKKYQAKKALSVFLALLMAFSSMSLLSVVSFAAPTGDAVPASATELDNGIYLVSEDKTMTNYSVKANATVFIDIAQNVTLTVLGGDASNRTGGAAGIKMNTGSKLVFTGAGTLIVKGGNGANGGNGSPGTNQNNGSGGAGGNGGDGGAGGGAGIGTSGGAGGAANGNAGSAASSWPTGAEVIVSDTVTYSYNANNDKGANGSAGNNGTTPSGNSSGGGGGKGGYGSGGAAIGTGGNGGGAGGQGTKGSKDCSTYSQGSTGSAGGNGTNATPKGYTETNVFSGIQAQLSLYSDLLAMTVNGMLAQNDYNLGTAYSAIDDAWSTGVSAFGKTVIENYFSDSVAPIGRLETAKTIVQYITVVNNILGYIAVDYSEYTKDQLVTLYENLDSDYTSYKTAADDNSTVKAYFETDYYGTGAAPILVRSVIDEKLLAIQNAQEIAVLKFEVKPAIETELDAIDGYDQDWVVATDNAGTALNTSLTAIKGYIKALAEDYLPANVVTVFGEDYSADTLTPAKNKLEQLLADNEYKETFAGYVSVYQQAFAPVTSNYSTDQLYAVLNARDAWYTDLQAFFDEINEYDPVLAGKVLGELKTQMETKINSVYAMLNERIEAQINTAYGLYQNYVAAYGYVIDDENALSTQQYNELKAAFDKLNPDHYNFLLTTDHFDVSEETVAKYNELKDMLFAFKNYNATKGLSVYEFNNVVPVDDITRTLVPEYDKIRNEDYTVNAGKRATAYENVKKLLNSDLVKGLLGDSFDLASLGDTVKDFIFSDSLVNTLISLVYPIVIDNFAPVWATQLPETFPYTYKYDAPFLGTLTFNFNFPIKQNLCTLPEALAKLNLYALPNQLAAQSVMDDYPEIQEKLAAVTYDPVYDVAQEKVTLNPWNDPSLVDEDGNLALEWGVHDKDSLVNALSAALYGVEPIILALLSNKTTEKSANIRKNVIQDSATAVITVKVTIETITLNLSFEGNPGFNNALAPILSALGAEDLENGNNKDLRGIATLIANGFDQIITKLSADPLDFLLKALPNLAYALNFNLITPLLDELKETIKYSASAYYTTDCSAAGPDTISAVDETSIDINLGQMLDLEEMGIDLTSASGLINSLIGLLGGDEEAPEEGTEPVDPGDGEGEETSGGIADLLAVLPIDELFQRIAYAGDSVTWKTGHRTVSPYTLEGHTADFPYINATPAEVFAYLVDYILDLLKSDEDLLPRLLTALNIKDIDLNNDEAIITQIIKNVLADPDNAIAAIVELMLPVRYTPAFKDYTWAEPTKTYNPENVTASDIAYLKYANNWDKPTATAVVEQLDSVIPAIAKLAGQEDFSLNGFLQEKIGGVFSNETIKTLAETLAALAPAPATEPTGDDTEPVGDDTQPAGDGEEAAASGLDVGKILAALGIDLSTVEVKDDYGFEDGNASGFIGALCDVLAPFAPILAILIPGTNFKPLDGVLDIQGYDVYPESLAVLFESLGIEAAKPAAYEGKAPNEALNIVLQPLAQWIDDLLAENTVKKILTVLPNLIYFLESNGLGTALFNLLIPVNILLEIIHPIYPITLQELIGMLAGKKDDTAGAGDDSGFDFVGLLTEIDLYNLKLSQVIGKLDEMLGTNLYNSKLVTYAIPAMTSGRKDHEFIGDTANTEVEEDGKHGYIADMLPEDALTILLCGLIEAFEADSATEGVTNGEIILGLIGNEQVTDIYTKLVPIITGGESEIDPDKITPINWAYMMDDIQLDSFEMPEASNAAVQAYLSTYDQNDWTRRLATYLDNNLNTLVADILQVAGQDPNLLSTLLSGLINDNLYTAEVVNAAGEAIYGLLADLEDQLKVVIDALLGTEIAGKTFTPVASVNGKADFIAKMKDILNPFNRILGFVLFGQSYKFFNGSVNNEDGTPSDLIVLNGGDAYDAALVPVLEALGVTMPKKDTFTSTGDAIDKILKAVTDRLDEISQGTKDEDGNVKTTAIDEILDLLPNVLYFLNADGLKAIINNAVAPFDALVQAVTDNDIATLLAGVEVGGVALNDLNTTALLTLIEDLTGIQIPDAIKTAISTFYIGKAEKYDSANGKLAFKLVYDGTRKDMITILASVLLDLLKADSKTTGVTNGELIINKISEATGNDQIPGIYTKIMTIASGVESAYTPMPINWAYMTEDNAIPENGELPANPNAAVQAYLSTYEKNQWTAELATYLNDNLNTLVPTILQVAGQEPDLLSTMLSGLINDNLYTADVVNAAGEAIYGLLDNLLEQLEVELGDSVKGVIDALLGTAFSDEYVPVTTVNGKADFIAKMENILNPFSRILGFILFGQSYRFFRDYADEHDQIIIYGGDAYDAALVPVLEALGVTMPKKEDFEKDANGNIKVEEAIDAVLTAVTDRLDEISQGTKDEDGNVKTTAIDEILLLLPNVLYFLNADGLKAIINNAVAPFDALVQAVTGNDIATLLAGVEVGGVVLNNLNTTALLTLIEGLLSKEATDEEEGFTFVIPDAVKEAISTFYIGKAEKYDSANGKPSFKLAFDGDRKDMITILASVLIEVLAYEDNAKILKGVGKDEQVYQTVINILGMSDVEFTPDMMRVPDWLYPEAADTDQTFSAINTSTEFGVYGPLFTQDMAVYIANNLDSFIDNLIYLLGIPADALEGLGIHSSADGYITSLKDLLNTVIGDTIYTTDIADLLLNLVEEKLVKTVNELKINNVAMGDIVKNVLKTALNVDLDRYTNGTEFTKDGEGKYHVQPFADGSKEGFLNALVQILDPLYPVLNWLLCEEDIHFFTDSDGKHEITLKGGQGYKYGIIPILETFDCTDLPTQAQVSATTDTASLVNTIATPLLSRIDTILENPVDEIFELLPNVAYFINSKGLDACVRNMVSAVNVILEALNPLVGDVDLFAAIGIDLATIDMQYILNAITGMIGEDSDLAPLVVDALAEMTTGKIVTSSSQSELTPWYKMEYAGETSKADTITTLLRFALRWVGLNGEKLKPIVREKIEMSDEGYAYIDKLIDIAAAYAGTNSGMDSLLHMLYYIFYAVHTGTTKVANWQKDYNTRLELVAEGEVAASKRDENLGKVAELLDWLFVTYGDGDGDDTGNVYHNYDNPDDEMPSPAVGKPKGFAPNGFIAFFRQIIEWFKTIFNKIFKH